MKKKFIFSDRYLGDVVMPVVKCKKPKIYSMHRGATWDHYIIFIDDVEYKAWLDSSQGKRFYFQHGMDYQWYACPMWFTANNEKAKTLPWTERSVDIDPTENRKEYQPRIKTQ